MMIGYPWINKLTEILLNKTLVVEDKGENTTSCGKMTSGRSSFYFYDQGAVRKKWLNSYANEATPRSKIFLSDHRSISPS